MKTRRRSFSHRARRARPALQWWASQQGDSSPNKGSYTPLPFIQWPNMTPATPLNLVLLATQNEAGVVNGPNSVPTLPQQITTYRLVGDILLFGNTSFTGNDPGRFATQLGIIVVDREPNGTFTFIDPSDPSQATRSWLWLRSDIMKTAGNAEATDFHVGDIMRIPVDITVRRRLREDQALVLFCVCNTLNINTTYVVNVRPAIRILYSRSAP